MPSEFVDHFTRSLVITASRPGSPAPLSPYSHSEESNFASLESTATQSARKTDLHALLVTLNQSSISVDEVQHLAQELRTISPTDIQTNELGFNGDSEEVALEEAIVGKLTVALYSGALDTYLGQAAEVEAEAEWWADVEGSTLSVLVYFLQSKCYSLNYVLPTY